MLTLTFYVLFAIYSTVCTLKTGMNEPQAGLTDSGRHRQLTDSALGRKMIERPAWIVADNQSGQFFTPGRGKSSLLRTLLLEQVKRSASNA